MLPGFPKESCPADAFRDFLNWLDAGTASDGRTYLETRGRLVQYFERKNCSSPDELADETLNRVARRLAEEGAITDISPAHYCYIVAKFVLLEYKRRPGVAPISLNDSRDGAVLEGRIAVFPEQDPVEPGARRMTCLRHCLQKLTAEDRDLILEYYHGERRVKVERRRALARSLGMTVNALSIRACRLRSRLEECVRTCYEKR